MKPPSMLKLHGRPYHRITDSFRNSYNTVTNNARMYIYDHERQSTGRSLHLDSETVKFIGEQLRRNNSWVKQYRALLLETDNSDEDNMSISFLQKFARSADSKNRNSRLALQKITQTNQARATYTHTHVTGHPKNATSRGLCQSIPAPTSRYYISCILAGKADGLRVILKTEGETVLSQQQGTLLTLVSTHDRD